MHTSVLALVGWMMQPPVTSAQSSCSDLAIVQLQWAAFSDTLIGVKVMNSGTFGWSYPSFDLLNGSDTLARGQAWSFVIGPGESQYRMNVLPGATIPTGPFVATLELWIGDHAALSCTFDLNADLCPSTPCIEVHPLVNGGPFSFALDYSWDIVDTSGTVMGSGTLTIGDGAYEDTDTLCLPPGDYVYNIFIPFPIDEVFTLMLDDIGTVSAHAFFTGSASLPFTVLGPCMQGPNGIDEPAIADLAVWLEGDLLHVSHGDGGPLGTITVTAVNGQEVLRSFATTSLAAIDLSGFTPGVYLLMATGLADIRAQRFVLR